MSIIYSSRADNMMTKPPEYFWGDNHANEQDLVDVGYLYETEFDYKVPQRHFEKPTGLYMDNQLEVIKILARINGHFP